jgi:hypothetical protein
LDGILQHGEQHPPGPAQRYPGSAGGGCSWAWGAPSSSAPCPLPRTPRRPSPAPRAPPRCPTCSAPRPVAARAARRRAAMT